MLLVPSRIALGYFKAVDNRRLTPYVPNNSLLIAEEAFGHPGAGGSVGFADPMAKMSFGYTMNRMGDGVALNERGQALVDAAYLSQGYTTNAPGSWIK